MVAKFFDMLSISRIFAVFPVVRKGSKYEMSKIWVAYSVLCYSSVVISHAIILRQDFNNENGMTFDVVLDIFNKICRLVSILCALLFLFTNLHKINTFVSKLDEADAMLARCGGSEAFERVNFCGWWMIAQVQAVVVISLLFTKEDALEILFTAFDCASYHYILTGCVVQFSTFATHLEHRLDALNHTLHKFTRSFKTHGRGKMLLFLSDIHYHLTETATELDNVYYKTYFVLISQAVLSLTTTSYKVALAINTRQYGWAVTESGWLTFWIVLVLTTVLPCASAKKKSKIFNEELAQILIRGYVYDDFNIQKRLQVHVDFDYIVTFTCGFFELDRTLIHSILGGVGSFTMILIQISKQKG